MTAAPHATRRPTLKSVAKKAGVSVSTASIVFSGNGPVADKTRTRVLRAAEKLGYAGPDPLAASLRRGRTDVIGVLIEGGFRFAFEDPYALTVADGLATGLEQIGSAMLLLAPDPRRPHTLIERVRSAAVDGLILFGQESEEVIPAMLERDLPLVTLGGHRDPRVISVDVDNRKAMRPLLAHLRQLGHQRVGLLTLPLTVADLSGARVDVRPLAEVLTEHRSTDLSDRAVAVADAFGGAVPTSVSRGYGIDDGLEAAARLLDLPARQRPTAIIACSDQLAAGSLRAAADRDLRVPDDLSVTGFDGVALPFWPGELTTVVQPGTRKGETAIQLLQEAIEGGQPSSVELQSRFQVGTSTAPPPRAI